MSIETATRPTENPVKKTVRKPKEHGLARRWLVDKPLRAGEGRTLNQIKGITKEVNSLGDEYAALSDEELQGKTKKFKERLEKGETLDDILPEAFATVREAAWRVLGMKPYDVQVMGGIALHKGNVAEMATGEGKTLAATMPAYLNALDPEGKGVHVVTVNDYLSKRDAEWMGPVYKFLGLSVGILLPNRPAAEHKAAYNCDITYGTNNEFGFDYLRDNMAWSKEEWVQRGHGFAIVDEVDSILIDEARTPLIISGPAEKNERWQNEFARLTQKKMKGGDIKDRINPDSPNEDVDYEFDPVKRTVWITEKGVSKIEDLLGTENLYENVNTPLVDFLNNALKAKELYKEGKEYIIEDGKILIIDEFTGRILFGRRYNEGIHQAIEAKEGVEIKAENEILATTSLQNYFRLYDKLSGMTGTASTEEAEFNKVYKMKVVTIPTHRPTIRKNHPDVVYQTEKAKFRAVVEEIIKRHEKGQPILVGTTSVEDSDVFSIRLNQLGIPHNLLNARTHAQEAEIIAQAGRLGAVTIATNMAGRGTDILLGGNPEFMAEEELSNNGITRETDLPTYQTLYKEAYEETLAKFRRQTAAEYEEVVASGGLYVLGTERHDSRRIDNQLRGRAGRQGDPGESRFFLSLQDNLMKRLKGDQIKAVLNKMNIPEDTPIESKIITRQIRSAQTQIEQQNAEVRKDVLKYDNVLRDQRTVIYKDRNRILKSDNLRDNVHNMIKDVVNDAVANVAQGKPKNWDLPDLWEKLKIIHQPGFEVAQLESVSGGRDKLTIQTLRTALIIDFIKAYDERADEIDKMGKGTMHELERRVLLSILDRKWREQLYEMDALKDGIGLRAYAQRDPLVEYQREGFSMFATMKNAIKEETLGFLFNAQPEPTPAPNPEP